MALSKLPSDAELNALKTYISDLFRQYYKKNISILVAGKLGVGKSSLVNALVGRPVAVPKGRSIHQDYASEAKQYFCEVVEGIDVRVWDSPGLQDDTDNDDLYLADILQKTKGEIDLMIYCLKMDDRRFYPADKEAIKKLTETFGKELWNHAVIALTFANKVEDPAGVDEQGYFMDELAFWQDAIHSFFTNELNIGPGLLQFPPIVPTGYYQQHRSLPNCKDWLTELWVACYNVARNNGAFTLVIHKDSNPSWNWISKKLKQCLLVCAIGLGFTLIYYLLNWFRPKQSMK